MSFPFYFSTKIALSKDNKNNLSRTIIFIGRLSVAIGVIISLITVSIGIGSKNAIKSQMADFSGHANIKTKRSNVSNESSVIDLKGLELKKIQQLTSIASTQKYITHTGIMRTEKDFAGIVFKGVGEDFDKERFKKFIISGELPTYSKNEYNQDIIISEKIAKDLKITTNDSIVTIFAKNDKQPIYRKFHIKGIYRTNIKMIDEQFVIGDIKHSRKIVGLSKDDIGGVDIFFKNINHIDKHTPEIEKLLGLQNYVEKVTDKYPQVVDMIEIFDNNILIIITLMLIVVIINIIMVLLILIIERTNSIGMLKTLGATNRQIQIIFIYYTLMIMLPGLVFGNLIGMILLSIQRIFEVVRLNPDTYYISSVPVDLAPIIPISISLGMFIISGISMIVPTYFITKIPPMKAVK